MTAARPLPRSGAIKQRARSRPCSDQLHHHLGHDPLLGSGRVKDSPAELRSVLPLGGAENVLGGPLSCMQPIVNGPDSCARMRCVWEAVGCFLVAGSLDWVWDGTANPYRSYPTAEQRARKDPSPRIDGPSTRAALGGLCECPPSSGANLRHSRVLAVGALE
jgi:hypothetical protein